MPWESFGRIRGGRQAALRRFLVGGIAVVFGRTDNTAVFSICINAVIAAGGGQMYFYRNTNHVTVSGSHGFNIRQLKMEKTGPGNAWHVTVHDLNDPNNFGIGDTTYWVVVGNIGTADDFDRNGGATVRSRRIGSTP